MENVKAYMVKVADAEFARLVECVKKGSKHKSTTFHRYAYDELEIEQTDTLKLKSIVQHMKHHFWISHCHLHPATHHW